MFALIETRKAVYDRVMVIYVDSEAVDIWYPKRRGKEWHRKYETIPRSQITRFQYYQN